MKKLLALLMVVVLCFSLCACGTDEANLTEIDSALQGAWEGNGATYIFDNGEFFCEVEIEGISLGARYGVYEITQSEIKLMYDNDVEASLKYSYEDGYLSFEDGLDKN